MSARIPSFPVTYSGEADNNGDVSMTVAWELPAEIKVSGIAVKNEQPCSRGDHLLSMTLNGTPVVRDQKFQGCDEMPAIPASVTDLVFDLQLKMTGFAKAKRTRVRGRAEIFYEDAGTKLRIPNTITVPYAVRADTSGRICIEAAWKFPVEVTVRRLFVQSRDLPGNAERRARLDLTGDDQRATEVLTLRGTDIAETGSIAVVGRRFGMSILIDGFAKDAEVAGAVLVVFEP